MVVSWSGMTRFIFKEVVTYREGGLVCPICDAWYDAEGEEFLLE